VEDRHVRYEVAGPAATLTLDRPDARNALSAQAMQELQDGLTRAEGDAAVRVVVLTGAGPKVFCSGGDLSTMSGEGGFLGGHEARRGYGLLLRRIQDCPKPTIARLNGHALAGGVGLVLACDLAIAADTAELGLPEIDRGLFPMTVLALLQRHLGRKRALELLLTGARLPAAQAQALGLINRIAPAAALDAAVAELVQTLAGKSQATLRLGKRAFYTAEDMVLGQALEHLAAELSLNVMLEDTAEGVTAFLEKRKPTWKDR
jgi:enoyl-CoA hydratase